MKKNNFKRVISAFSITTLLVPTMLFASPVSPSSNIANHVISINSSPLKYSVISDATYSEKLEDFRTQLYVMVTYKIATDNNGKQYKMITQAYASNEYNRVLKLTKTVIVNNTTVDVYYRDGLGRDGVSRFKLK